LSAACDSLESLIATQETPGPTGLQSDKVNSMTTPIQNTQGGVSRWTAQTVGMGGDILDRMERAVAKVRERLLRAAAALDQAHVPYAVVGGNAVASWVATVDDGAVRTTRGVHFLVRRRSAHDHSGPRTGWLCSRRTARRHHVSRRARGQAERGNQPPVRRGEDSIRPSPARARDSDCQRSGQLPRNLPRVLDLVNVDVESTERPGSCRGHDQRRVDRCIVTDKVTAGIGGSIETYYGYAG
jgi:hypothetical protein